MITQYYEIMQKSTKRLEEPQSELYDVRDASRRQKSCLVLGQCLYYIMYLNQVWINSILNSYPNLDNTNIKLLHFSVKIIKSLASSLAYIQRVTQI